MSHYFTDNKETKSNVKEHKIEFNSKQFFFKTDHGVFSKKGLDFGSRLLLEEVIKTSFDSFLDLGCGYGVIGIITKKLRTSSIVIMVDINDRAIELAKSNATLNKVQVHILKSDGFEAVENNFDCIATNPPIRAGKKVIYKFFEDAFHFLKPKGYLFIVIQKKHGAESTLKKCKEIYTEVNVVSRKHGYVVLKCEK